MIMIKHIRYLSKIIVMTLSLSFIFIQCAVSPAHRIIPKGEWAIDISSNLTYSSNWTPVIPNLNMGLKYGVSNKVNVGLELSPLMIFIDGIILFEPYIVYNFLDQRDYIPRTSVYAIFPTLVTFSKSDAQTYPLLGLHTAYKINRLQYSLGTELLANFYSKEAIDLKNNVFLGIEYYCKKPRSFQIELGVNDIGAKNEIFGWKIGQPFIKIGFFKEFKRGR